MTIELRDLPIRRLEVKAMLDTGHEVTVTEAGTPVGKLVPVNPPPPLKGPRVFDMHPGSCWISPDFNAPMMLVDDPAFKKSATGDEVIQRLGFAKGSFREMAPDFDDPLPDEFWLGEDA